MPWVTNLKGANGSSRKHSLYVFYKYITILFDCASYVLNIPKKCTNNPQAKEIKIIILDTKYFYTW